jgi:hypothetical protein
MVATPVELLPSRLPLGEARFSVTMHRGPVIHGGHSSDNIKIKEQILTGRVLTDTLAYPNHPPQDHRLQHHQVTGDSPVFNFCLTSSREATGSLIHSAKRRYSASRSRACPLDQSGLSPALDELHPLFAFPCHPRYSQGDPFGS